MKINGAQLVKHYLGRSNVDAVLEHLSSKDRAERGWETDVLEIKGTYHPTPELVDVDDQFPGLFEWNIMHAVISLANANGGCIVIGIAERKVDNTLVRCDWDPDQILSKWQGEDFARLSTGKEKKDLLNHVKSIFFSKKYFNTGKEFHFRKKSKEYSYVLNGPDVSRLAQLVEFHACFSEQVGCDAIVLVVNPIPKSGEVIAVARSVDGVSDWVAFCRSTVADTNEITSPNEFADYRFRRNPEHYDQPSDIVTPPIDVEVIEDVVARYLAKFSDRLEIKLPSDGKSGDCMSFRFSVDSLSTIEGQRKVLADLKGMRFTAVCIKSCGGIGFLEHSDFENGIFLQASVANDIIAEGDKWEVSVGFRFNQKRNVWCYCAESATRIGEVTVKAEKSFKYRSGALLGDTTREKVASSLCGKRFSGVCAKADDYHKFGFLSHPDFDSGIFLHSTEAKQMLIYCGQKWIFNVEPKPNRKKGGWGFVAMNANFEQHLLSEIVDVADRKLKLEILSDVYFEAFCVEGNKTHGFLIHPSFEGLIYVDLPVTRGVEILTGSKWRFRVGARVVHPYGPWSYGAKDATRILRSSYDEQMLDDEIMRSTITNELAGNLLNGTVISVFPERAFVSLPQFSNGVYYPRRSWHKPTLAQGDKVKVEVMPSYNKTKKRWCYEVRPSQILAQHFDR